MLHQPSAQFIYLTQRNDFLFLLCIKLPDGCMDKAFSPYCSIRWFRILWSMCFFVCLFILSHKLCCCCRLCCCCCCRCCFSLRETTHYCYFDWKQCMVNIIPLKVPVSATGLLYNFCMVESMMSFWPFSFVILVDFCVTRGTILRHLSWLSIIVTNQSFAFHASLNTLHRNMICIFPRVLY